MHPSPLLRYTHNFSPRFLNRQSRVVSCVVCRQLHTAFSIPPVSIVQYSAVKMVEHMKQIISKYQRRIVEMSFVPKRSYSHSAVGINGSVNMVFLTFLFSDKDLGIEFLKDVGLIRSKVLCNMCSRDMTWCADPTTKDGFRWRCRRKVAGAKCSQSQSIRHDSWFQQSPHLPGGTVPHI